MKPKILLTPTLPDAVEARLANAIDATADIAMLLILAAFFAGEDLLSEVA